MNHIIHNPTWGFPLSEPAHLRFAPETLAHLGERLVPGAEQAIIELVKNAYDADARTCTVKLDSDANTLSICDDGDGMTEANLKGGWLVLGKSGKGAKARTKRFNRVPVGDKGLGRLAALRLGGQAEIRTRPKAEPGKEYRLTLDWDAFARAKTVEEVDLFIKPFPTEKGHGTDIYVSKLRNALSRSDVSKLARGLVLLSDPFQDAAGFRASLEAKAFEDLERRVHDHYFGDADYQIEAELDANGRGICSILDWKGEPIVPPEVLPKKYATAPLKFQLWVFSLGTNAYSTRQARASEIRPWLQVVGGVHVYEGPIRVPPYGDEGVDWLDINLRRVRSPEARPSTNNSVGRVIVDNSAGTLEQKTDRVGYLNTPAFAELVTFSQDVLDWASKHVLRQLEGRRERQRTEAAQFDATVQRRIETVAETMPPPQRAVFRNAVQEVVAVTDKRVKALQDDLQLYRSLATAGMTSAVFSHEIGKPLGMVTRSLELIEEEVPLERRAAAKRIFDLLRGAAERLNAYVDLPMSLLRKEKRKVGRVDLIAAIDEAFELFSPIVSTASIEVVREVPAAGIYFRGSHALIDGIFANFIANTMTAFQREDVAPPQRVIRLRIVAGDNGKEVRVQFADNAGGLRDIAPNEIWLPGSTTRPNGTGFGLTIVRDSVTDLGGKVSVDPRCDLGGAEFTINLPVSELRWR